MAEEKEDKKDDVENSKVTRIQRKQTTGKDYEAHSHSSGEKKKCAINCNPTRPHPNDILERAMHFDVNAKGRKCTDCYCLIVYLVFLLVWAFVAGVAVHFGSIYALLYGRDYQDNICGVYNGADYRWWDPPTDKWGLDHPRNFLDKKYLYYPRLNDDLIDYAISLGTTVKDLDVLNMDIEALLNITLMGVCVEKCPTFGTVICTNDYELKHRQEYKDNHGKLCDETKDGQCKPNADTVGQCRGGELLFGLIKNPFYYLNQELCTNCWVTPLNTTEIFYRCLEVIWNENTNTEKCIWPKNEKITDDGKKIPLKPGDNGYIYATDDACITKEVVDYTFAEKPAYDNPVAELLGDSLSTIQGWMYDIANAFAVILVCGCCSSIVLGFLWIFLLRWLTKPIVWGTIVVFLLVLFAGAGWSWLNSGWIPSSILAEWIAEQFNTLGISHPALDFIIYHLNNTAGKTDPVLNLTEAINLDPITKTAGGLVPDVMGNATTIDPQTLWQISSITTTVLLIAGIVTVIILAKKIMIAIAIIEEAAVAVMRMPHMVFLPFGTAAAILIVFLWFAGLGTLIQTLEDVKVEDVVNSLTGFVSDNLGDCGNGTNITSHLNVKNDLTAEKIKELGLADKGTAAACNGLQYFNRWGDKSLNDFLLWFHIFCFLWTNELLQAITICTVAGAVCDWYWTRPSGPKANPPNACCQKIPCFRTHGPDPKKAFKGGDGKSFQFPLLRSFCRTVRFHLGSLAFGSFLVALVQLIRLIFEYIKRETKPWAQKNKCFQTMFKVITIILFCFEKCLKFITKNAYIMIAMQGHAFCDSCCHAFKLLLTNLVQFVLVSCFSKVVVWLGKITITLSGGVAAYFWLSRDPAYQDWQPKHINDEQPEGVGTMPVGNKFLPVFVVVVLGYFCASAFLHVYDLAISTILLCFCEDYKVHQVGDPHFPELHKEVYMPNSLRRIVLSPTEFAHMQQPMTQEQIMNMAGVDTRSDAQKKQLSYEEIIDICKKVLLKSDEYLHMHIPADKLTEKDIIDKTGGPELMTEMRRPNPMYDKNFAADLSAGRVAVKKGYHDKRLDKYRPELTQEQLFDIIERANKTHQHMEPLTHEQIIAKTAKEHGDEYAKQLNETPSRQKVAKRQERRNRRKQGRNASSVEVTPVNTDVAAELKKENADEPATFVSEEGIL